MVSLSATLVDESHEDCRAIKADSVGAALWPFVVKAHQGLLATQRILPTPERLQDIIKLGALYDGRHDDVIRGIWHLGTAMEFLHERPEDKEQFRRLRDKMLPDKLLATTRSYREEAGQAELMKSRLDAADWALLRRIYLPSGRTMADAVLEWLDLAAKLGALEHERTGDPAFAGPTAADVLAARNIWIRAMRMLRDALELSTDLSPTLRAIVRRIDVVIARAAERRGDEVDEGDEGGEDPDTDIEPGDTIPEDGADDEAPLAHAGLMSTEMGSGYGVRASNQEDSALEVQGA